MVGDPGRKAHYRQVIERLGGEFTFLDGFRDIQFARSQAKKSDVVFLVIASSLHNMGECLYGYCTVVQVTRAGMKAFEEAVKRYVEEQKQVS